MPTRTVIDDFLAQDHLALVGVSRDDKATANAIYRHLRDGGHTMYAVNKEADTIEGDRCFHSLDEVPGPVDGVIVMVDAEHATDVVRQAVDRGIPRVWLYRGAGKGAVSEEAVRICQEHEIACVDGACPFMFDPPVKGIHRVHRFFSGRRIAH